MSHRSVTVTAIAPTPFGAYVEVGDVRGIAKRPSTAFTATQYEPGEEMTVLTDGEILGADGGWLEVRGGIAERGKPAWL